MGHLLDPDHERDFCPARLDGLDGLMHGRGPGRAGVLDARRRLEPETVMRLQHDRGGEVLRREPALKCPSRISSTAPASMPA
jgi:hypothetical protein